MCCGFLGRRRKPPPRPSPSLSSPRRPRPVSNASSFAISSSSASSTAPLFTDISTTSTSSLGSLRDLLPDGPIIYRLDEILLATENFSPSYRLAPSVWRGVLRRNSVAISERPVVDSRLFRDVLRAAHSLHHSNLVRLLGGCRNGEHSYLVYEFVEGGNLKDCLRSRHAAGYSALSSWHSRIQIAVDVAKGLEYLHHLALPTYIHRHISSRNILVGNDHRAKIAHIGVSALSGESHQKIRQSPELLAEGLGEIRADSSSRRLARSPSLKITGAKGYMPPEYRKTGEITPKYDVFAFGVVLSELLSGQDASQSVTDTLRSVLTDPDSRGKLRLWMDPLLKDSYPVDDALKIAMIAITCVDPQPEKRPQMSDIALKLHKYLVSAEKWEVSIAAQREIMTSTLQPR